MLFNSPRGTALAVLLSVSLLTPAAVACAPAGASQRAAGSDLSAPGSGEHRDTRLSLPRPTGRYGIGGATLHLTDTARRDPWVDSAGDRQVMVSLRYPARHVSGHGERMPYMSAKEAGLLLEGQKLDKRLKAEQLASARTHTREGARPAAGRHPLILLSPGFTLHRATLTVLAEELASRGYVVALVDHAYESFGSTFPDGDTTRTLTCVACETVEKAPDDDGEKKILARAARTRAADLSFVVDELTRKPGRGETAHHDFSRLIDPRRIGAAGHSLGGNAAAVAAGTDHRVRAAANLDGSFFAPVPRAGTGRPVLMLGTRKGHTPQADDRTWPRQWTRLHGWKRWLTVADAGHFSFNDLPVLGGLLGMSDPSAPLPGERCRQITTDYVTAFFDRHLRGQHRPLLNAPTKTNPEVTFHTP
ncbi:alpha/beta hydrolase [Streptomyces tubbatahanensis]|uniref:Alpha/beta hydrolase n=1 Tax=Streptomyces tubbatahanensis TaxID=2923272 RepID=A0ABY3Y0Q2_9ACTN|nr:alpha/beta hydrolase [Streptomyces tubbatahanensis]UNT00152.1 alpha/beta hydrolase [Streptomyces tubbatahanensis]